MSCKFCDTLLTEEELAPYKNYTELPDYLLLCKKHWCECLPQISP